MQKRKIFILKITSKINFQKSRAEHSSMTGLVEVVNAMSILDENLAKTIYNKDKIVKEASSFKDLPKRNLLPRYLAVFSTELNS